MQKTIDIAEALHFGWDTLRENFALYLKILIVWIVISILPTILIGKIAASSRMLALPLQFLNIVWQAILAMGAIRIGLKLIDGKTPEIPDLWSCIPKTLDYLIVKILVSLIVAIGFILLIVPGCIWMLQFFFSGYLVVDRGEKALAAMKHSSTITNGAKWPLAGFAAAMFVVNLVGLICFGVGILVTLPITMLASLYVYRKLLAQTGAAA